MNRAPRDGNARARTLAGGNESTLSQQSIGVGDGRARAPQRGSGIAFARQSGVVRELAIGDEARNSLSQPPIRRAICRPLPDQRGQLSRANGAFHQATLSQLDISFKATSREDGPMKRELANLSPAAQLRAGRLGRRIPQLFLGLTMFAIAMGLFVRARVGVDPWDVFHQGVSKHTGLSMGTVTILTAVAVLLFWIPLKQWPGLGTVANAAWLGVVLDITLHVVPAQHGLLPQYGMFFLGLLIEGLGGAMYIGSQLGPGPRDGLMTGLNRRTGISVRLARTSVEITALVVGWFLGGSVGIGTVIFALAIGPLTQFFLPHFIVELPNAAVSAQHPADALEHEQCADLQRA